jgi:hypothetical protein
VRRIVACILATCPACGVVAGLESLRYESDVVGDGGSTVLPTSDAAREIVPPEPPQGCPSAGRRCVPAAPAGGWTGPLFVYDGPASGAPTCPSVMALPKLDAFSGSPSGGAHTCSGCSCGAVVGVTCEATLIEYWEGSCTVTQHRSVLTTACTVINSQSDRLQTETRAVGGSCAPSGGTIAKGPIEWPAVVLACGAPELLTAGCAVDEVCAPEPRAPFAGSVCIARPGDQACPSPWSTKKLHYGSASDTRSCSMCSCDAPLGVVCSGTFAHDNGNGGCDGTQVTNYPLPTSSCINTDTSAGARVISLTASGGACNAPAQSTPTGGITGADPVTVCCLP